MDAQPTSTAMPEKPPKFLKTILLHEKVFEPAREFYRRRGGVGEPDLSSSQLGSVDSGHWYIVLRDASGTLLATYRHGHGPSEVKWPEPHYVRAPRDHVYALGVIGANYVELERSLALLFILYIDLPQGAALTLFTKLSNELRIETLRDVVENSSHPGEIKAHVERFISGFMTIFNARNILMHGGVIGRPVYVHGAMSDLDIPLWIWKLTKKRPASLSYYQPTLRELRSIADSAYAFTEYGEHLNSHILLTLEQERLDSLLARVEDKSSRDETLRAMQEQYGALPEKPPAPTPLNPRPLPAPDMPADPPQSSGA